MSKNDISYREEILRPFFKYIESGDSFFVVGAPSVGKTRLIDFLMGDDFDIMRLGERPDRSQVKKYYLGGSASARIWLVRVDSNRLRIENGWDFGFFELLLNTLLLSSSKYEETNEINDIKKIKEIVLQLSDEIIRSQDALMSHRYLEMAITRICQIYNVRICFLFDEFDEIYETMPKEIFSYLRAIRDANKYFVSYALFLRNLPEKLRDPAENESFYELISRNRLGLGPFSKKDSFIVIGQLEKRYDISLSQDERNWLYGFSGGHPGFIQALLKLYKAQRQNISELQSAEWCANQDVVQEECRKIWIGLLEEERQGLVDFIRDNQNSIWPDTEKLLITKGILKSSDDGSIVLFSPLLKHWLFSISYG